MLSQRVADGLPGPVGTRVELQLKGKRDPQTAYRLAVSPGGRGPGRSLSPHGVRYPCCNADVAQLVEHFTRNEGVPGSSPGVGSRPLAANSWGGAGVGWRDESH